MVFMVFVWSLNLLQTIDFYKKLYYNNQGNTVYYRALLKVIKRYKKAVL